MGMFDEVVFEAELAGLPSNSRHFQTKSLDCCLERYIVTKAGRLCLAGSTFLDDEPFDVDAQRHIESVDIDFHGDIRLVAVEGEYAEYVARFTHGTLEWVRPLDESHRANLALMKSRLRGGG
jgi:hypothetical protein